MKFEFQAVVGSVCFSAHNCHNDELCLVRPSLCEALMNFMVVQEVELRARVAQPWKLLWICGCEPSGSCRISLSNSKDIKQTTIKTGKVCQVSRHTRTAAQTSKRRLWVYLHYSLSTYMCVDCKASTVSFKAQHNCCSLRVWLCFHTLHNRLMENCMWGGVLLQRAVQDLSRLHLVHIESCHCLLQLFLHVHHGMARDRSRLRSFWVQDFWLTFKFTFVTIPLITFALRFGGRGCLR